MFKLLVILFVNIQSTFKKLFIRDPQGSILRPLLFKILINDVIGFIKRSSLYNFADYSTITAFQKDIALLKETLQNEAEIGIQWFKDNFMIVNPGKFQTMVINRFGKMENRHKIYIDDKKLTSKHSVKLRGIEMDNQLKCDSHVSTQCQKTRSKLNAIGRLGKYFGKYFFRSLFIFKF